MAGIVSEIMEVSNLTTQCLFNIAKSTPPTSATTAGNIKVSIRSVNMIIISKIFSTIKLFGKPSFSKPNHIIFTNTRRRNHINRSTTNTSGIQVILVTAHRRLTVGLYWFNSTIFEVPLTNRISRSLSPLLILSLSYLLTTQYASCCLGIQSNETNKSLNC